jgi:hypothetical protein
MVLKSVDMAPERGCGSVHFRCDALAYPQWLGALRLISTETSVDFSRCGFVRAQNLMKARGGVWDSLSRAFAFVHCSDAGPAPWWCASGRLDAIPIRLKNRSEAKQLLQETEIAPLHQHRNCIARLNRGRGFLGVQNVQPALYLIDVSRRLGRGGDPPPPPNRPPLPCPTKS